MSDWLDNPMHDEDAYFGDPDSEIDPNPPEEDTSMDDGKKYPIDCKPSVDEPVSPEQWLARKEDDVRVIPRSAFYQVWVGPDDRSQMLLYRVYEHRYQAVAAVDELSTSWERVEIYHAIPLV